MSTCIFCKIIAGEVPCHRVYEDERVLAFLDIGPLARGHTLVVPRRHAVTLDELSADEAAGLFRVVPMLGRAVSRAVGAAGWNVLQNNGQAAGQAVDHVHVHLIPRREADGLGYRWPAGRLDPSDAPGLLSLIRAGLTSE